MHSHIQLYSCKLNQNQNLFDLITIRKQPRFVSLLVLEARSRSRMTPLTRPRDNHSNASGRGFRGAQLIPNSKVKWCGKQLLESIAALDVAGAKVIEVVIGEERAEDFGQARAVARPVERGLKLRLKQRLLRPGVAGLL